MTFQTGAFQSDAFQVESATTTITGSLAVTDSADACAIVGDVCHVGSLAVTDSADTCAFTGDVCHVGSLAVTETADSIAATGDICHVGVLSASDNADTAQAYGDIDHVGILAATDGEDTFAAIGTVSTATTITGDLAATDDSDSASASGIAGQQYSGGFDYPDRKKKTEDDIKADRIALGILPPEVAKIATKVARKAINQAAEQRQEHVLEWVLQADQQALYERQLRMEMSRRQQVWDSAYSRLLEIAVQEALQMEEEAVLMMMMEL